MTKKASRLLRRKPLALAIAMLAFGLPAHAAPPAPTDERLSDWLLRQPNRADYPLGLVWQVPERTESQARLKNRLLADLAVSTAIASSQTSRQRLSAWLESLPVTGRAPLKSGDPRWLQAHPRFDPILGPGQGVRIPPRPSTVTVILGDGRRCAVPHRAGAQARAYLAACAPERALRTDNVWIAQPDGHVERFDIADWNMEAQTELAPGAWVWAPARDEGWPTAFSEALIAFLATQGPAADEVGVVLAAAPIPAPAAQNLAISASDWGEIGLLQTPTARMAPAGTLRFSFSRVYPYGRGNVFAQPFDWLEAGFRYTDISNRLYGPDIAGDQSYKDKSIDFKLRLAKETATTPELALGIIDMGGTGLFSSEYLVASKRTGSFDWSLGLAWGYLGHRGSLRNPLALLAKRFETRDPPHTGQGGVIDTANFFRGRTALFGGVQYQTDNWLFKAEYDGNHYQSEPQGNNRKQSSPLNFGAVWRYSPSVDISFGFERGNTAMLGFSFHGRLDDLRVPKLLDPPRPAISPLAPPAGSAVAWEKTARDLESQTQWRVAEIRRRGGELIVVFEQTGGAYWNERVERAIAVLHRDAPADIERFALVFQQRGLAMSERVVWRAPWVAERTRLLPPGERIDHQASLPPFAADRGAALWQATASRGSFGLEPDIQYNIGGPDGFILYQIGASAVGELNLDDRTWLSSELNFRLIDNYDKFKYTGPSKLPRVRTYLREYRTASRVTLPNLQLTHVGRLGANQFFSLYGGYLEAMFAGVGAEWLYRPQGSRLAFGVDLNRVQQRDFEQDFGLRDYRVTTGHATLYLDTGWQGIHLKLAAGQYLAGDRGVTLDASRVFANGVRMGVYATKTNVSAETFGEGSFDKGIYLSIPFEAMLPKSSRSFAHFIWNPLTRDGGARLGRAHSLFNLSQARDPRLFDYTDAASTPPASTGSPSEWSFWGDLGSSAAYFGSHLLSGRANDGLLSGSLLVLGSALLDRPADRWARSHATPGWNRAAKVANSIPFLLAGGTGLFWLGLGDDGTANTAWTSLKAAGFTLATEVLVKTAAGRARPKEDLGATHFAGPSRQAFGSSLPSIHTGVAFALVTPFAEHYDAPWLYGLAGLTALGRLQQREHFVSDTVAGALIGYGVSQILLDQQRTQRKGPRLAIGENRTVGLAWDF